MSLLKHGGPPNQQEKRHAGEKWYAHPTRHCVRLPVDKSSASGRQVKKKKFIDKKTALNYEMVHRDQRDPLTADENAAQNLLKPIDLEQKKKKVAYARPARRLPAAQLNDRPYRYNLARSSLERSTLAASTRR